MAYINIPQGMPGIRGLMAFRPETAKPLNELVEVLLQGASRLSKGERELIAAYVSGLNECKFCAGTHGAIAKHHFGDSKPVEEVKINPESGLFSPKLRSLLAIAAKVQKGGLYVTNTDVEIAREYGATDLEIHDTVLIAAAFCMFNRYVDGLGTEAPAKEEIYDQIGAYRAKNGYLVPNNKVI
ncbi:MAG: carboxymuconolactone decarboxylase [Balneolaceae bacterium]|nr:MAG: carboxymuconolactone decarboxylase [Balneolaceae bacterium]